MDKQCARCGGPVSPKATVCKACYLRGPHIYNVKAETRGGDRIPPDLEAVERVRRRKKGGTR